MRGIKAFVSCTLATLAGVFLAGGISLLTTEKEI